MQLVIAAIAYDPAHLSLSEISLAVKRKSLSLFHIRLGTVVFDLNVVTAEGYLFSCKTARPIKVKPLRLTNLVRLRPRADITLRSDIMFQGGLLVLKS